MARENNHGTRAIWALVGGFLTLLYAFYYIEQLSYSIGIYKGIQSTINTYNITASSALLSALSQSSTLALALDITYILLPFALIIFSIGIAWLFTKSYSRFSAVILLVTSILYMILVVILSLHFNFANVISILPIAYIGGFLAALTGAYSIYQSENKVQVKRAASPIVMDPETPYSNMKILSNRLMKRLGGEIKIIDMHFDATALDNLIQLIEKHLDRYTQISVITKIDRLGNEFEKSYKDFKVELANKKVGFELRVVDENDASKQHERILMDGESAYKIPPINIINKKSEHIVSINHQQAESRFHDLWSKATKFENLKG